ncbi:MAG: hypothetical protein ACYS80_01985 [Planctomycetota bacterium]|jgi:hypothetical protein
MKANRKQKRVWHITDFAELYELADDLRKERSGPLRYTKSLVTLSPFCPDAESRHFERMRRLKARPERHLLRSIFEDLKNWTGSKPYGFRGYLTTAEGKAASSDYLAEQLSVSVDEIEKALPELEQLGFLERIPMSEQPEPKKPKRKTANKKSKTSRSKAAKKQTKKSTQKNKQKTQNATKCTAGCSTEGVPEPAGLSRTEPESVCPPSRKNKNKVKGKGKGKGKTTSGLTAPGFKRNNNGNGKDNTQGKANGQVPCPPTTQPLPSEPRVSDEGGRVTLTARPPESAEISRHGLSYGRRVYLALGYRYCIDSPEAAREIGSFASKHDTVCQRLSALTPTAVDAILSRGLREAAKIAKRPANKNPGAVWHTVMDKLAAAAQRSPPCEQQTR